jgi:uncharacterized membrane protein YdjX (TVP38/TMEM64 family)
VAVVAEAIAFEDRSAAPRVERVPAPDRCQPAAGPDLVVVDNQPTVPDSPEDVQVARTERRTALLRAGLLTAVLIGVYCALLWAAPDLSVQRIRTRGHDLGPLGVIGFVVLGVVLNTFFVPFPVVAAAGGLLFGVPAGTAAAIAIAPFAACAQMLLTRHVVRDTTSRLLGRRSQAVNDVLERRGFIAVVYVHLVPVIPNGPLNYAAGLTSLRIRDMAAGTALAKAPRAFAYVALGGSLSNLAAPEAKIAVALLVVLAIGGLVAIRRQVGIERARRSSLVK